MAKYRVTAKGSLVTVKSKLAKTDVVNEREIEYLLQNYIKGLFKISYDGKRSIEYTAPMAVPLGRYLKNSIIDDLAFWKIIAQILQITMYVEINGLYQNNLWLDINAIFINEVTKDLYFIYQPFVAPKNQGNAFALINDITYMELKKVSGGQKQYLINFQNFLGQGNQYRMDFIRNYVEQVYPEMRIMEQETGRMGKSAYTVSGSSYGRYDVRQDELDDTVCLHEEGTVVLGAEQIDMEDEYGATTVLIHEVSKSISMVRQKDKQVIKVSGKVFRIGKGNENDYLIKGNTAVSRKHAVITQSEGEYYVEDKNSTNGTFVNGTRVGAAEKVLLQDGDEIIFADEIYVIQIE